MFLSEQPKAYKISFAADSRRLLLFTSNSFVVILSKFLSAIARFISSFSRDAAECVCVYVYVCVCVWGGGGISWIFLLRYLSPTHDEHSSPTANCVTRLGIERNGKTILYEKVTTLQQ